MRASGSSMVRHRSAAQAPVAQLDRALPSEGKGREFESRRVRHLPVTAQTAQGPNESRFKRSLPDGFGRQLYLGLDAPHGVWGLHLPFRLDL